MQAKWLLSRLGAEDIQPLKDALERAGYEYKILEDNVQSPGGVYDHIAAKYMFDTDDCVIFFGTLGMAAQLQREVEWIPGVYHNIPAYRCTHYYPRYAEFLLNSNYIMLPFGELMRQKEFLYEHVGNQDAIFIRPDTGSKSFTGRLLYKEHFNVDIKNLGYNAIFPEELVVVAEPQNIEEEYRFVCVNGTIVTGSLYRNALGLKIAEMHYEDDAWTYAQKIADKCEHPDDVFCIDVCWRKHAQDFKLLEIGCFSCAGLYACNKDIIVEEVSLAAEQEWRSYNVDYGTKGDK